MLQIDTFQKLLISIKTVQAGIYKDIINYIQ